LVIQSQLTFSLAESIYKMFHIERDKNINSLQSEVNSKILDIVNQLMPEETGKDANDNLFVSVEDAAKELLRMGVKG
jgi:hypothetical protein